MKRSTNTQFTTWAGTALDISGSSRVVRNSHPHKILVQGIDETTYSMSTNDSFEEIAL
jgi:hypothetical protein